MNSPAIASWGAGHEQVRQLGLQEPGRHCLVSKTCPGKLWFAALVLLNTWLKRSALAGAPQVPSGLLGLWSVMKNPCALRSHDTFVIVWSTLVQSGPRSYP